MIMISVMDIDHDKQHAHAQNMLKICLKKCGINYDESMVSEGLKGKPYLPQYPEIHYNLSHANGIAACMVSDRECGIDCEAIRTVRPNVMRRCFSESECLLVENAPESERDLMFTRLWTLKEAYGKTTGLGINYHMKTTCFSFKDGEIHSAVENYTFRQYIIKNKYVVSLCQPAVDI